MKTIHAFLSASLFALAMFNVSPATAAGHNPPPPPPHHGRHNPPPPHYDSRYGISHHLYDQRYKEYYHELSHSVRALVTFADFIDVMGDTLTYSKYRWDGRKCVIESVNVSPTMYEMNQIKVRPGETISKYKLKSLLRDVFYDRAKRDCDHEERRYKAEHPVPPPHHGHPVPPPPPHHGHPVPPPPPHHGHPVPPPPPHHGHPVPPPPPHQYH